MRMIIPSISIVIVLAVLVLRYQDPIDKGNPSPTLDSLKGELLIRDPYLALRKFSEDVVIYRPVGEEVTLVNSVISADSLVIDLSKVGRRATVTGNLFNIRGNKKILIVGRELRTKEVVLGNNWVKFNAGHYLPETPANPYLDIR